MPGYSVTVRNEGTGETRHVSGVGASTEQNAAWAASISGGTRLASWQSGPASCDFYQLDPELDTFSFGYYSRLEDAQADGLHHYREHMRIMQSNVGQLSYVKSVNSSELDPPQVWNIVDDLHPQRHITMCQIVKYDLWTARQTTDPHPDCIDQHDPHISHGDH